MSSAYYALYHQLVEHATAELVGEGAQETSRRNTAARWFAHTDVRNLAEAVIDAATGRRQRALSAMFPMVSPELSSVVQAFVRLQDERHSADYDHDYDVDRSTAVGFVALAREAIVWSDALRKRNDGSYQLFLRLMVGGVKIAKNR